ncbi:glycosyltransferase [Sphingomonas glacialis]|uniref:Glycosyltransferase n=1 Tax=Sphingomonas glacialis TaxID=658225 RepID=A0A502FTW5_9SPHN|nr:glycosyltransferase [Sphingomonas glacialis]TPG52925.1 glycosyltransferase [Sphingomonas glacialis]
MLSPRPPAAHILAFAQTLEGGGVEKALLRLVRGWSDLGRRVTLVLGDAAGPLARDLPDGVETRLLGRTSMIGMGGLASLTHEIGPDVLFCPGNHYSALAAWTKMRLGRACPPIVAKISNALVRRDHGPAFAMAYRRWLRCHPSFVDRLVAMSPAMADEACAEMGASRAMLSVIPNPPVRAVRDAPLPEMPAGRFLLGVGRLAPQKRWDRLIDAFDRIADRDIALMILGEGAERAALEAQIAALGLGGRVSLPGHVADPTPVIARAAALALVSDFEGVPGVLRESLAVGTPVITTDSSVAVREIVTRPALGSIVTPGDAGGLVAALDHWLAPGRARPRPVPQPGEDAAAAYLDLFDEVVLERRFAMVA